jgi:osmoprotectant transport system ATP-binding protein
VNFEETRTSTVGEILKLLQEADRPFAFVKNAKDRLEGYVLRKDLEQSDKDESAKGHLRSIDSIQQYATLMEAISLMVTAGITAVPVVDDRLRMLGVIRFSTVFKRVEEMAGTAGGE